MITSRKRPSGLPTYQQIKERGFSDEEAVNILSMDGNPEYIWASFRSATPATKAQLDSYKVDFLGRPLPKTGSVWSSK